MNDHDQHAHGDTHAGEDHGDMFKMYMTVFIALTILTGISFLTYEILGQGQTSMVIILLVSVVKATLVAMIFMHLKFDWGKVFAIMIPVVVMAIMMIIVLLPDAVLGWHR